MEEISKKQGINKTRIVLIFILTAVSILLSVLLYVFPFNKFQFTEEKPVKVYIAENITQAHWEIINRFNKMKKGEIEVVPIHLPYDKFTTNKRKELIARNLRSRSSRVDIFAVDQIWIPRFSKWAEPLDRFFAEEDTARLLHQALETCVYKDTLFSIPFFIDVGVLYYREDILKQVDDYEELKSSIEQGITWEELINLRLNKKKYPYKYAFHANNFEGFVCNFMEVAGGEDGKLFDGTNIKIQSPESKRAAELLKQLIYEYKISPQLVTTFDERTCFQYALEHDIPFFRGWPTGIKNIEVDEQHEHKKQFLRIAPLPRFENHDSYSSIGGWNLMVSKFSEVKEEAIEFIKFAIAQQAQNLIFKQSGYLPILDYMYSDSSYTRTNKELKFYYERIKTGIHRLAHPQYTKISDIITTYLNDYLENKISLNRTLNAVEKEIQPVLEQEL